MVPYSKKRDPSYSSSNVQQVQHSRGRTRGGNTQLSLSASHFTETMPPGTPNRNHWRMLMMAPAHIINLLAQLPQLGKYSQCRIPDFQVGDSVLVPAISKSSFVCPGTPGAATLFVYPCIENMADSGVTVSGNTIAVGPSIFKGATSPFSYNRAWQDVYNAGKSARCVGYCVEVKCVDSANNAAGRVGIVNIPSDPYNAIASSTIDDLANQPSALVGLSRDGVHMSWMPDANVTTFTYLPSASTVDMYLVNSGGGHVSETTWRYQQFWPNGLTTLGTRATTIASTSAEIGRQTDAFVPLLTWANNDNVAFKTNANVVHSPLLGVRLADTVPCLMVVVDGAATSGSYMFNVYSHWEVTPDTRGKLSEPGATGQHASSGTGLLSKAEHVISTVIHDGEAVAKTVVHGVEDVWSIAKDVGKVAAIAAAIL